MKSLVGIGPLAPHAVEWLQKSMPVAHGHPDLKKRILLLMGAPLFVPNLDHFGLWDDFIQNCKAKALEIGEEMQQYYVGNSLATVLGEALPNAFGKLHIKEATGLVAVVSCSADECTRRQDAAVPSVDSELGLDGWVTFPWNSSRSQLWNEKCYIHHLRMVAIGINTTFQKAINEVCVKSKGEFKGTPIKGYTRMKNKCTSKTDHFYEAYPRPALNIDLNRNCCTFETANDIIVFIGHMQKHPMFGGRPVRIKNMYLYNDDEAKQQFYYRTVMINWLYTPGITYKELAEETKASWGRYYDYEGDKDPSESWSTWRAQIGVAMAHLTSEEMATKKVQFIVETQLLLRPYLVGREKMVRPPTLLPPPPPSPSPSPLRLFP
jgi:hypothetical protein